MMKGVGGAVDRRESRRASVRGSNLFPDKAPAVDGCAAHSLPLTAVLLNRLRVEIEAPSQLRYIRLQWVRFQSDRHLIGLKIGILAALFLLASLL